MITTLVLLALAPAGCAPAADAPGLERPFHVPSREAWEHHQEGVRLYRDKRFAEARAAYEAAHRADPAFLAPLLAVAGTYARQERYPEAAKAATDLIARAFVPWASQAGTTTDLLVLRERPEKALIDGAVAEGARRWGDAVRAAVLFVARNRAPLKLPPGQGTFVLGLHQEIVAYHPGTGRYLQVTDENGRVLAALPSPDGARVLYVTGGKLVRGGGRLPTLRGLRAQVLELPSMIAVAAADLPETSAVTLAFAPGGRAALVGLGGRWARLDHDTLDDVPAPRRPPAGVTLDHRGVRVGAGPGPRVPPCARKVTARDGDVPRVEVTDANRRTATMAAPLGAGLYGLPWPP